MLAYVFWHSPREGEPAPEYEAALEGFHRSLSHQRPVGMIGSATFAIDAPPWRDAAADGERRSYEDWYLLEDFAALGVLNEAAVGRGHRTAHDRAARHFGAGAGGLYVLDEGQRHSELLARSTLAVWVARPPGSEPRGLGELLGDGIDPTCASLWRRQLVLGPAGEYCLLAAEVPEGVAATRLPSGWTAHSRRRELIWHG